MEQRTFLDNRCSGKFGILLGLLLLLVGCSQPEAELTPEDAEQARQEHIGQMQNELGGGGDADSPLDSP